ncbi:MAG: ABC transporter permease subunit [Planctomycetes bacterium]|nr:ABC transporter permease subunit [Planctomycetota bacterium]
MSATLRSLWLWLWHLLPANPILVRVVCGASRRPRHLWMRVAYLGVLLGVVLISLFVSMGGQSASLAELAKGASQTFKFAATAQLALMCFLAPVFTAGAITQERDAQTFNILLSTPLSSAQIVFGSLMSRLYFVMMLLLAGLPIFLITMVYGGVTTMQILESFALAGSTAFLTGALAIFIAMIRIGTRVTIFSFYLVIGLYLLSVYLLGLWDDTWVAASPPNIAGRRMSWLTPLHPFLALDVALNRVHPPTYVSLAGGLDLTRYALAFPSAAYLAWTLALALLLTLASVLFVRRGAKIGEPTVLGTLLQRFSRRVPGERTRAPRTVWANPVAWREARTRAAGGAMLRWTVILGGLAGLALLFLAHVLGSMPADEVRPWLAKLIIVQFAIAVIIATNTAATSMTKEKESKTMDLLLTTPLTSKYILWGKLRGLVSFAVPLLLGPVLFLLLFGIAGLGRKSPPPAVWIETAFEIAALMIIYTACACVIGLRISLISRKNVAAVMYSVGLVILLFGTASMLGFAVVRSSGGAEFGALLAPFTPFTSIFYLVDPLQLFDANPKDFAAGAQAARTAAVLGSTGAAVVFAFVVWSVYTGLVRNFDMIVRKQSGT